MKFFPYYKIKYRIAVKTEADLKRLLENFIKPNLQSTEYLFFVNSDKTYDGELKKNEFTLTRNYGSDGGSKIIQAKGTYKINNLEGEIILTVRPNYGWLLLPFVLLAVGIIYGNRFYNPLILFFISYILLCIIPINVTGQGMIEDLSKKLQRHLIEKIDLATGILKY